MVKTLTGIANTVLTGVGLGFGFFVGNLIFLYFFG